MKRILLLALLVVATFAANAQFEGSKQVFESPNLKNEIAKHKIVAILPFATRISFRKPPKDYSAESNKAQEDKLSTSIQSSLYTFLLRKASNYSVEFQDVERTNVLLRKAGVFDKLNEMTKDEIAKILQVDAVIGGQFETEQTRSEAGAIATTILFGGIGSKTGTGTLMLTINDGEKGSLIWRFFKSMDDNVLSSSDVLVERMMRKVSRNFPYTK